MKENPCWLYSYTCDCSKKKCAMYGNRYLGNTEKQKQVILFYMSPFKNEVGFSGHSQHSKVLWGGWSGRVFGF